MNRKKFVDAFCELDFLVVEVEKGGSGIGGEFASIEVNDDIFCRIVGLL